MPCWSHARICVESGTYDVQRTPVRRGAGWPREVALPGLPQIRSCAIDATGSSVHGFAARRWRAGITADGSG